MAEDSDRKPKVKRQDSARKNDNPQQQLLLAPGPGRILCAPSDSPEYRSFLTNFCSTFQNKQLPEFNDIGMPEARSLVHHITERNGSDNAALIARELQVLMIISRSKPHREMFLEIGGVQASIGAMRRYAAYPDVQVQGCKSLVNMGKSHAAKDLIGQSEGIQTVVDAMEEHKEIEEVQEVGCWAMGALVVAHVENKHRAAQCGAVEAVVDAVKAFGGVDKIQQVGLWALGSLAANFGDNSVRIGRRGGVTHVIGVAKTWIDHPMIAEMACWALANMAAAGGKPADYIVKKEGPQAVMAVMKKWEKAPNIQYAGTVALAHLGSESALTKLLDYPAFVFFQ